MPTPKPLRILMIGLEETDELTALRDKGHTVLGIPEPDKSLDSFDLVVGPNCWRLTPKLTKYLDLAVKEARRHRYGPRKGKDETGPAGD